MMGECHSTYEVIDSIKEDFINQGFLDLERFGPKPELKPFNQVFSAFQQKLSSSLISDLSVVFPSFNIEITDQLLKVKDEYDHGSTAIYSSIKMCNEIVIIMTAKMLIFYNAVTLYVNKEDFKSLPIKVQAFFNYSNLKFKYVCELNTLSG
jgi:hypothetical protein